MINIYTTFPGLIPSFGTWKKPFHTKEKEALGGGRSSAITV